MGSERFPYALREASVTSTGTRDGNVRTRHVSGIEPLRTRDSDVRLTLPARPENVSVIRHVLGAFAEALHLPDPVIEDIRLAVTEACTNVVRHAYGDGQSGPIDVRIH